MKNEDGFTLAEVLIASGLLGLIALGSAQLSKEMALTKARTRVETANNSILRNVK